MTPTRGDLPIGPGWAFEVAWDGLRATVDIRAGRVQVRDGSGNDVTDRFPEAAALADGVSDALLDGELVAADGGPVSADADADADANSERTPAVFLVLDLLRLYGVELADRPFRERRRSLERLAATHPAWTVPPAFDDAAATLAAADRHGLRGVVAKRLDSPYRPGVRSPDWVLCPLPSADVPLGGG